MHDKRHRVSTQVLWMSAKKAVKQAAAWLEVPDQDAIDRLNALIHNEHRPRPFGREFLDELARRLAMGVASVCAVLDPGLVVLAGEIGRAGGKELAARVEARANAISPLRVEVRVSTVEGNSVLQGALLTALSGARDDVFDSTTEPVAEL